MLADVVLPSRRFQVFTYHIPPQLRPQVCVGSPVLIPLGSSVVSGIVVRILERSAQSAIRSSKATIAFRDILSVDDTSDHSALDQRLLALVAMIADYYLAPLSACLRLIVPPRVYKVSKRVFLLEAGRRVLTDGSLKTEDRVVLEKLLRSSNGLLHSSLLRGLPKARTRLTKLKKEGWIEERSISPSGGRIREPKAKMDVSHSTQSSFTLPDGRMEDLFQEDSVLPSGFLIKPRVFSRRMKGLANTLVKESLTGTFQKRLVIGTDQERLQVFQQVSSDVLKRGKQVLLLVPEVHLAEAIARQLQEVFSETVVDYHGQLSLAVRADCWRRIRQGQVQLVVGTRSALFVPLPDLGLIWVDREEDPSYKDEQLPYYHAREVAGMRGAIEQILVAYGSMCPSLEIYSAFPCAFEKNMQMTNSENPVMNLIDMRNYESGTILALPVIDRLTQVLNEGHQAILILNRKGFSQSLICRDCGQAPVCEICGVALRLFQRPSRLLCSYCGKHAVVPETCSSCRGTVFRFAGMGTQRLEEELTTLFPSSVVSRFDRDQVKTAEEGQRMLRKFSLGDIHLLIGTEFLLHQPDPPSAKLMVFPQADLGLHLPDFRSAERTFPLFLKALHMVEARGQRDDLFGEVFFQTRMPNHHVFQAIIQQDPKEFYQTEFVLREALAYPPLTHLVLLVITGMQAYRVERVIDFLKQQLKESELEGALSQETQGIVGLPMMLGPLNSKKPGRLKKNRTIFLIKTFQLAETQRRLQKIQQIYEQEFGREPVVFEIHVDPIEIQ